MLEEKMESFLIILTSVNINFQLSLLSISQSYLSGKEYFARVSITLAYTLRAVEILLYSLRFYSGCSKIVYIIMQVFKQICSFTIG